jgi:hypothetical protein
MRDVPTRAASWLPPANTPGSPQTPAEQPLAADAPATSLPSVAASSAPSASVAIEPAPPVVYCQESAWMCSEWTGLTPEEFAAERDTCSKLGHELGRTPCPQADLLGTCEHWNHLGMVMPPEKLELHLYKAGAMQSLDYAKAFCAPTGKFVEAGPTSPEGGSGSPADAGRTKPAR